MTRKIKTWLFRRWLDWKFPGHFDWRTVTQADIDRTRELADKYGWLDRHSQ